MFGFTAYLTAIQIKVQFTINLLYPIQHSYAQLASVCQANFPGRLNF